MHWITPIEFTALLLFVGFLVWEYAIKSIRLYAKCLVYISWLAAFSFLFLIPEDAYYT